MMAVTEAEVAIPKNAQSCFGRLFDEKAFLEEEMMVHMSNMDSKYP